MTLRSTRCTALAMIAAWMGHALPAHGFTANHEKTVRCESSSRETVRCAADTRAGVVLQRQLSRAGCWYDETWGFDARGIWVSNGCRADFALGSTSSTPPSAAKPPDSGSGISGSDVAMGAGAALVLGAIAAAVIASNNDDDDDDRNYDRNQKRSSRDPWRRDQVVRCESNGKKQSYCRIDTRRGVELYRQLSKSRCRYGSSWGYDRKGIWVDEGCRAEFLVRG